MSYFTTIAGGLKSLVTGLGITARQMRRKPVTLTYPHVKPELSEAYRSLISLVQFEELETHDCIACMQCHVGQCVSPVSVHTEYTGRKGRSQGDSGGFGVVQCRRSGKERQVGTRGGDALSPGR